jgi:hypothetical protein
MLISTLAFLGCGRIIRRRVEEKEEGGEEEEKEEEDTECIHIILGVVSQCP